MIWKAIKAKIYENKEGWKMKKAMVLVLSLVVFLAFSNFAIAAPKMKEDFEKKELGEGWEVEGDAVVAQDKAHAGKGSLMVAVKSTVSFTFAEENCFGVASFWVLDPGVKVSGGMSGSRWGIKNADDDKFCLENFWAAYLDGNAGYAYVCTSDNSWFSHWWPGVNRKKEWCKWTFDFTSDDGRMVTADDATAKIDFEKVFKDGFVGLFFMGAGDEKGGVIYVDDVDVKANKPTKK